MTFAFSSQADATVTSANGDGSEAEGPNVNMASEHPLKTLMAEDNSVNQMVAKRLISKLSYRINIASNGVEAIGFVKKYDYDLVLVDQYMPVMDGIESTQKIRQFAMENQKFTL